MSYGPSRYSFLPDPSLIADVPGQYGSDPDEHL